jgi:hypothetical protein
MTLDVIAQQVRALSVAERKQLIGLIVDILTEPPTTVEAQRGGATARQLLESGLVGLWADRDDIGDSAEFARTLREKAQRRKRRP